MKKVSISLAVIGAIWVLMGVIAQLIFCGRSFYTYGNSHIGVQKENCCYFCGSACNVHSDNMPIYYVL